MRRRMTCLPLLAALVLAGCLGRGADGAGRPARRHRVAVLYSHDEGMPSYHDYDSALERRFAREGVAVAIERFYLDPPPPGAAREADPVGRLLGSGAELVVTEGDKACYALCLDRRAGLCRAPVVAGGVTALDRGALARVPDLYLWHDKPDYQRLLLMMARLTGSRLVMVELGGGRLDSLARRDLRAALCAAPFVDGARCRDGRFLRLSRGEDTLPRDSVTVLAAALDNPDDNAFLAQPDSAGGQVDTEALLSLLAGYPQLRAVYDHHSFNATHLTHRPSFTTLPYLFGCENSRLVAGRFVSMAAEGDDVASTASRLLRGERGVLRARRHEARDYMDYRLMGGLGLTLAEAEREFTVVNVPPEARRPCRGSLPRLLLMLLPAGAALLLLLYSRRGEGDGLSGYLRHLSPGDYRLLGRQCSAFRYVEGGEMVIDTCDLGAERQRVTFSLDKYFSVAAPGSLRAAERYRAALATSGRHCVDMEISWAGERQWWRYRFVTRLDRRLGKTVAVGVQINIDDEVERRAGRERARLAAGELRGRERFLNSMNHEIRTPLNTVLGCSQLLAMPGLEATPQERAALIGNTRLAAERLMGLVQDILSYCRIVSGRMTYDMEPMDVGEMMDALYDIHSRRVAATPLIDENGEDKTGRLRLEYVRGAEGLTVAVDNRCMQQVVGHLVSNAVKFTDRGVIRMGWRQRLRAGEAELFVEDCGAGMSDDDLGRLGQAFYKGSTLSSGVGLGLALVRSMTESMGGRVEVDSRLGLGSRFSLVFPLRWEDSAPQPADPEATRDPSGGDT